MSKIDFDNTKIYKVWLECNDDLLELNLYGQKAYETIIWYSNIPLNECCQQFAILVNEKYVTVVDNKVYFDNE